MSREKLRLAAALCAFAAVLACSKSQAASGAEKNSITTSAANAASSDFSSEMGWNEMSNSGNSAKYTALPNVGERAYYKIGGSAELMSKKGKMYCSVTTSTFDNTGDFTADRGAVLAAKLGALCTKMFAAT